jgi:hypothetical protein
MAEYVLKAQLGHTDRDITRAGMIAPHKMRILFAVKLKERA